MMVSALSHFAVLMFSDPVLRFMAFLVFEACVGLYFPMIGTLKGDIVPEDMRSTIYNIYRFPLNVAVLLPLLLNFSITTTFIVTTSILIIATVSQVLLMQLRDQPKPFGQIGTTKGAQAVPDGPPVTEMGNMGDDEC